MDGMTAWMNEHVAPVAGRIGQNKVGQAISQGMMQAMPITIGIVAVAIIVNLPILGLTDMLTSTGTVQLPWATPTIISATMQSGPLMGLVVVVCIAATALLYLPFFKVADQQAYEEEQAIAAAKSAE